MNIGHPWTCPHCDRPQTISETNIWADHNHISLNLPKQGSIGVGALIVACSNADCLEITVDVGVYPDRSNQPAGYGFSRVSDRAVIERRLIPEGRHRPQPDYIPEAIRSDYKEACLIRDLSPKASATLSRRCLQGMIRDFADVRKATLWEEIQALRKAVEDGTAPRDISVESIGAIDAVRKVGNIGAHMEKNVDAIIDVDPGEAQSLISLVEALLSSWYVERHRRQATFGAVVALAERKDQEQRAARAKDEG